VSAHRGVQAVARHPLGDRGGFSAGNNQAVEPVELLRRANFDRVGAEPGEHLPMGLEVPLDRKHAYPHGGLAQAPRP
jgi:hypothetical protein